MFRVATPPLITGFCQHHQASGDCDCQVLCTQTSANFVTTHVNRLRSGSRRCRLIADGPWCCMTDAGRLPPFVPASRNDVKIENGDADAFSGGEGDLGLRLEVLGSPGPFADDPSDAARSSPDSDWKALHLQSKQCGVEFPGCDSLAATISLRTCSWSHLGLVSCVVFRFLPKTGTQSDYACNQQAGQLR